METEIVENTELKSELTDFQKIALEAAEKELDALKKEIDSKKYLVDLTKEDVAKLSSFISNDADWKFTEALGILEVEKEMVKATKEGKLFTTALAIEAIYYYLSKVEGSGNSTKTSSYTNVTDYIKAVKSIKSALEKVSIDSEKVRNAEFIAAARREGIDPDQSINAEV
jgi:hypothetical protein